MRSPRAVRWWRVGALCAALLLCLWVGWHDFDPWIAQDALREAIRITIRRCAQIAVQFIAPVTLLALLTRELSGRRRETSRST